MEQNGGIGFNHSIVTGGNFTVIRSSSRRPRLEDNVAFGAMLKSAERYPAPRCHPDTRKKAQTVVKNWICKGSVSADGEISDTEVDEENGGREEGVVSEAIMWLSGAPGVGKSAILQTVCEELLKKDGPIDTSHFFGRGQGNREKAFYFPATVAYQLGRSSEVYRSAIRATLKNDPAILLESIDAQFRKLVVDTVAVAEGELMCWKPIMIVIDALDEVDDVRDQVALLELIFSATTKNGMRFFIASRPERAIHSFFHRPDVRPYVHHVRLDEETFQTSRDIYVFLAKSFDRIRQSRPGSFPILPDGQQWPGNVVLRLLTADSDAQFIFPHLIIESIDADPLTSPHEQLQSILNYTAAASTFSKLDALYHQILSRCLQGPPSRRDRSKSLLMGVLQVLICWPDDLSIAGIADVLDEEKFLVENMIRGPMRCLFAFDDEDPDSIVDLSHKSLRDCVLSRSRAGEFFISSDEPDGLFAEILSRTPPTNPTYSFPPQAVMGFMQCIIGLTYLRKVDATLEDIASIVDVGPNVMRNVLRGPQRCLFLYEQGEGFKFSLGAFRSFLDKTQRLRDPLRTLLDAFFTRILSLPPPTNPRKSFSRQDLMNVLRVIMAWPSPLTPPEIAWVVGMERAIVENVICGPQAYLFRCDRSDGECRGGVELDEEIPWNVKELHDFLLDGSRSGAFCVSRDALDSLLITFLSRPSDDSPSSFSRQDLKRILHSIFLFDGNLAVSQIASTIDVETSVVRDAVFGPKECLFGLSEKDDQVAFQPRIDAAFFMEANRSGEFHISVADAASLFLPMLSHPPPTEPVQSFSRQDLRGVLLVIFLFGGTTITMLDIAMLLGIELDVVRNVVYGPQHLLFRENGWNGRVMFRRPFPEFWVDPHLSGEFCISTSEIDSLLTSILSRSFPTGAQQAYCPWGLSAIIRASLTFDSLSITDLASMTELDRDFVWDLVKGPQQFLFHIAGEILSSPFEPIRSFFHDPERSGEFYISRDDTDAFLIRHLSIPPPIDPERSYSRQCLMDVIRILFVSNPPQANIRVVVLASKLNINPDIVHNIVVGPHKALFTTYFTGDTTNTAPERFWVSRQSPVWDIKSFLLDPNRSREFYLG